MNHESDRASSARARNLARVRAELRHQALQGLPYARIPEVAKILSDGAYKQLGALLKFARGDVAVEITDQALGHYLRRRERAVQYHWQELEAAGLIERVRRYGVRTIWLHYTLAGQKPPDPSTSTRNKTTPVRHLEGRPYTRNSVQVDAHTAEGAPAASTRTKVQVDAHTAEGAPAASTRTKVQVDSHTGANPPAPGCRFPRPLLISKTDRTTTTEPGDAVVVVSLVAQELKNRGLADATAEELAATIPADRIHATIEWFDWLRIANDKRIRRNPAGFLAQALRKGWGPPADFTPEASGPSPAQAEPTPAQAAAHKAWETRRKAAAAAEAESTRRRILWESLTEEERQRIRDQVRADNPGLVRFPALIGALCLERVEQTKTAGEISAKDPSPAGREGCWTIPDLDNCTVNTENSQEDSTRTKHNVQ